MVRMPMQAENHPVPVFLMFLLRVTATFHYHPTSKHQCMHLGSIPNLNSQASSPINEW